MKIREMTIDDYDEVIDMLRITPGITVREADSRSSTKRYLERNPGLSFVATIDDRIVGCVMCGHDGRRGYLQHLFVKSENRGQGIGKALFTACIDSLKQVGIDKTHLFVFNPKYALASTPSASIIGGMGNTSKASTHPPGAPTFWLCTPAHRASIHLTHFLMHNLGSNRTVSPMHFGKATGGFSEMKSTSILTMCHQIKMPEKPLRRKNGKVNHSKKIKTSESNPHLPKQFCR